MFPNLKNPLSLCAVAVGTLLHVQAGFAQTTAQDISAGLWQKFPTGYERYRCGFGINLNLQNLAYNCHMTANAEGEIDVPATFFWHVPVDEKGNLGNHVLGSVLNVDKQAWGSLLAFGKNNDFLAMDGNEPPVIYAMKFPDSADKHLQSQSLWQHAPFKGVERADLSITRAVSSANGGYVLLFEDLTETADPKKKDGFTVVQLNGQGKEAWQYMHASTAYLDSEFRTDALGKMLLVTSDGKTIIYGDANREGYVSGTFVVCLDVNGRKTSDQFFEDDYLEKAFDWGKKGFGFVSYGGDGEATEVVLHPFNPDCQKQPVQALAFPDHQIITETQQRRDKVDEIKALVPTAWGNLLIAYLQTGLPNEEEGNEEDILLPSLYLAEIDQQGKLIRDLPIVAGGDKKREYLQIFMDSEGGEEQVSVTLLPVPKTNEVLISIHNIGINAQNQPEKRADFGFPKLYRVKLP